MGSPEDVAVHDQINKLINHFVDILANKLTGIYLHGSLAMGCFNPSISDIDVLVVTQVGLTPSDKARLATSILALSGDPRPIELSCICQTNLDNWQHPCPFDFHYGDEHRQQIEARVRSNNWDFGHGDTDLAAHIVITSRYGKTLWGRPIGDTFPEIPPEDYWDSIFGDYEWAKDLAKTNPVYVILNYCRILAYKDENLILSKAQGGEWGLSNLPAYTHRVIEQGLSIYRGNTAPQSFDEDAVQAFMEFMSQQIET